VKYMRGKKVGKLKLIAKLSSEHLKTIKN
jgi:hypothetical protein